MINCLLNEQAVIILHEEQEGKLGLSIVLNSIPSELLNLSTGSSHFLIVELFKTPLDCL